MSEVGVAPRLARGSKRNEAPCPKWVDHAHDVSIGSAKIVQLALLVVALIGASAARADQSAARPPPLRAVALEPQLNSKLPLELAFTDAADRRVRLGRYFEPGRPVLLTLAYIECSMLCSLVVRGVADAVRAMPLSPGDDYRLVTVALDPRETRSAAADKQRSLLSSIGRAHDDAAWVYLRGDRASVRRLADALGFGYAWDPRTQQYAHPAAAFVAGGEGRVLDVFEGIRFAPGPLRDALRDGTAGVAQSDIASTVLSCFRFDPALRRHRERIQRFFRFGALGVFAVLAGSIGGLALWQRRRR